MKLPVDTISIKVRASSMSIRFHNIKNLFRRPIAIGIIATYFSFLNNKRRVGEIWANVDQLRLVCMHAPFGRDA